MNSQRKMDRTCGFRHFLASLFGAKAGGEIHTFRGRIKVSSARSIAAVGFGAGYLISKLVGYLVEYTICDAQSCSYLKLAVVQSLVVASVLLVVAYGIYRLFPPHDET